MRRREFLKKAGAGWAVRAFLFAAVFVLAGTLRVTAKDDNSLDTFTTIDFPGATRTNPRWVNPAGDIVGFYNAGGTTHGFLRSEDGAFTTIDFPGAVFTQAPLRLTLKATSWGFTEPVGRSMAFCEPGTASSFRLTSRALRIPMPGGSTLVATSWALMT